MPRPRLGAAACVGFDALGPDLAEPNGVEGLGGHRNAPGSSLYFATSSSAFSNAAAASPGVQPLASVLSSSAAMRRLISGSSLALGFFVLVMVLSPGGEMPRDHAVVVTLIREPGRAGKSSRLDGASTVVVGDRRGQKLGGHPLEESPVPAVRRERRRQHVVADHMEGIFAVVLTIAGGGLPHVGVGRLPPAVEPLDDQDEHAADDRRSVPAGDARINPGHGGRDEIQGRPPARFPLVDYRLHDFSRTENVTLSPWTVSPRSDAMSSWRTIGESWRRT